SGSNHYGDRCSGILRIEYKGAPCSDPNLYPAGTVGTSFEKSGRIERGMVDWLIVGSGAFTVQADGTHSVRILDVQGRVVASMQGSGRKEYAFPEGLRSNAV